MSSDEEEEEENQQINDEEDEEELEAVARTVTSDEDEHPGNNDDHDRAADVRSDDEDNGENLGNSDAGKRERARLKEMERLKRKKINEILDAQNAAIDADMNNKGKGRLHYLLQQTEIFAHFAKGSKSASQKKPRGRGRHASKVTELEEDEEYLKEEEDDFSVAGGTRLMTQPSCSVESHLCTPIIT